MQDENPNVLDRDASAVEQVTQGVGYDYVVGDSRRYMQPQYEISATGFVESLQAVEIRVPLLWAIGAVAGAFWLGRKTRRGSA